MTRTLVDLSWPMRTPRLAVRPGRAEDADALWEWSRRPEVTEWTTARPSDLDAYRERWTAGLEHNLVGLLGDRAVATGMIRVQDAWSQTEVAGEARHAQAELGWTLDPALQGRGLCTELAGTLLAIAIEHLGVRRVEATCFAANEPSWRIMRRIGMRQEAYCREDSLHRSGRWMDGMTWAVLASEYHRRHDERAHPAGAPIQ